WQREHRLTVETGTRSRPCGSTAWRDCGALREPDRLEMCQRPTIVPWTRQEHHPQILHHQLSAPRYLQHPLFPTPKSCAFLQQGSLAQPSLRLSQNHRRRTKGDQSFVLSPRFLAMSGNERRICFKNNAQRSTASQI